MAHCFQLKATDVFSVALESIFVLQTVMKLKLIDLTVMNILMLSELAYIATVALQNKG